MSLGRMCCRSRAATGWTILGIKIYAGPTRSPTNIDLAQSKWGSRNHFVGDVPSNIHLESNTRQDVTFMPGYVPPLYCPMTLKCWPHHGWPSQARAAFDKAATIRLCPYVNWALGEPSCILLHATSTRYGACLKKGISSPPPWFPLKYPSKKWVPSPSLKKDEPPQGRSLEC